MHIGERRSFFIPGIKEKKNESFVDSSFTAIGKKAFAFLNEHKAEVALSAYTITSIATYAMTGSLILIYGLGILTLSYICYKYKQASPVQIQPFKQKPAEFQKNVQSCSNLPMEVENGVDVFLNEFKKIKSSILDIAQLYDKWKKSEPLTVTAKHGEIFTNLSRFDIPLETSVNKMIKYCDENKLKRISHLLKNEINDYNAQQKTFSDNLVWDSRPNPTKDIVEENFEDIKNILRKFEIIIICLQDFTTLQ